MGLPDVGSLRYCVGVELCGGEVGCWVVLGRGMVGVGMMTKRSPRFRERWGLRVVSKAPLILLAPGVLFHSATFRESIDGSGDYWNLGIRSLRLISTAISRNTVPIIGFS